MESEIDKVYYHSKEVRETLGIPQSHLRHYCENFDIDPKRTSNGQRLFTLAEFDKLKFIHREVKEEGRHYWKIKELLNSK